MLQKNVIELTLGGKPRKCYFGIGFLGLYMEKTGVELEQLQNVITKNPFKYVPDLVYFSIAYGYVRQDLKPEFNRYAVADWIDEVGGIGGETIVKFLNAFTASLTKGVPQENVNPKARNSKKKV